MTTASSSLTSRPAAVAGIFYDADPHQLRAEVSRLLASARSLSGSGRPKAMIVPHAGYQYSGQVAATAFATLGQSASTIERVVLMGPAHYVPVRGIAAPVVEAFETPLGPVRLDQEVLAAISGLPAIAFTDEPHAAEHALEVELPFLQVLLPRFTAVPLLVGDTTPHGVAAVLSQVWGGPETVLVISSDLSHFLEYEIAQRRDAATADMIENGDWTSLRPADACGYLAIAGLLVESERRGLRASRLALCNSGDQVGSRNRVVGYGAWVFWT
jgi:AmmeMemoRadiSam system protein B